MPLDRLFDQSFNNHCLGWQLKFSLIPRTCFYSGKWIWLKRAYRGTAMWTGPGEPIFEDRWVDRKQYLFLRLQGKI
jgi:hypothetical protein